MFRNYIGRLIFIYGFAMALIISVLYVYYDEWLGQQFCDVETLVLPLYDDEVLLTNRRRWSASQR